MSADRPQNIRTFSIGDRVVLPASGECGVVVWTWPDAECGGLQDCYVAFFGYQFPEGDEKPDRIPYVLRYAASSLRPADYSS